MPGRTEFAKLYFGNAVIGVVKELLGLNLYDPRSEEGIVMELLNLLVSPSGGQDFELRWHRDDIRWEVDEEEEQRQLDEKSPGGRQAHTQYNIALFDDESLVVVPGSHRRVRTEKERAADPFEKELEGQVMVKMRAGDAVFYDSNIVHRGIYKGVDWEKGEKGRMTLHGSVGLYGHSEERAKNVLQHGVGAWVDREDAAFEGLQGKCRDRAEAMRLRLVEMGRGENLGFSLDG
jgi:Phytanoyl-CoA dioxygenase (PhyH)